MISKDTVPGTKVFHANGKYGGVLKYKSSVSDDMFIVDFGMWREAMNRADLVEVVEVQYTEG